MAIAHGKAALEVLKTFRSRKWFHKSFKRFADLLVQEYGQRNEVVKGGKISDATSNNATTSNISCTETNVMLQGKSYHASLSASTDSAITNKKLENSDKAQSSTTITVANGLPTIAGGAASSTWQISSGGRVFKARIYASDVATGGHDYTDTEHNIQLDIDMADDTADAFAARLIGTDSVGLKSVFKEADGYEYSAVSSGAFTITAPAGTGNDFTHAYNDVGSLTHVPSNSVFDFSGIIYSDGSSAFGVSSASDAKYYSIIATNSDNEGGVHAEGTNVQLLAVVAGSSSSAGTAFLNADEIQSALAASSSNVNGYNHSGATGWVYLAEIKKASGAGGALTITSNINNHLDKHGIKIHNIFLLLMSPIDYHVH